MIVLECDHGVANGSSSIGWATFLISAHRLKRTPEGGPHVEEVHIRFDIRHTRRDCLPRARTGISTNQSCRHLPLWARRQILPVVGYHVYGNAKRKRAGGEEREERSRHRNRDQPDLGQHGAAVEHAWSRFGRWPFDRVV